MSLHLVVGATGGIGRATVKTLLERGENVRVLVRDRGKAIAYMNDLGLVDFVEGDAGSSDDVRHALAGCSTLFYCVNIPYPRWDRDALELLAVSVDAALESGAKLVFPGNVYVFGRAQTKVVNEDHPHAAHTKKGRIRVAMEKMLADAGRMQGLSYVIVRFPDFYGPFVVNGFTEKLLCDALKGKTMHWIGALDTPFEAIYIDDAGKALVTAGLSAAADHCTFHVPGFGVTTAQTFLDTMAYQAGKGARISTYASPAFFGVVGLFSPVVNEVKEMLYLKNERLILDGARYTAAFGPYPATPYSKGIAESLRWAKEFCIEQ